jgi:tRNA U34 5-methylaminomethyl-2-thiouridine-forming methyltransferase MnmC
MTEQNNRIHTTKDGSTTLYSEAFDQYYHNPNGALSESKQVFFETSGVVQCIQDHKDFNVLEVGFGTGLNFLLLLNYCLEAESTSTIHFYTVEAFPITSDTAAQFDFSDLEHHTLLTPLLTDVFKSLKAGMNSFKLLPDLDVFLHVYYGPFSQFQFNEVAASFIFHDPFSPEVNDELWTSNTFETLKSFSAPTCTLTTYCAASKARAAMAYAGWYVAKTRGALGKREMTIASTSEDNLVPFKRVNEEKLIQRYKDGDFS